MPLVLPLAEVTALLVALIILFAATMLFRGFLQSLVARVPVVGHYLSAVIDVVISDTTAWVKGQIKNTLSGVWGLLMTPVHWIASMFERYIVTLYTTALTLGHIASSVIPSLRAELTAAIDAEVHQAEAYALGLDQQLYQIVSTSLAQVYAYIGTEVGGVDRYILSEIASVDAYITSEISTLTSYVQVEDARILAYVQQALAADESYAQSLYAQAVAYAQSAVISLDTGLTADLTGLRDWVTGQLTALDGYIAGILAAAYAYADTRVATVEADLQALKTGCTDNLCENLTPLANLFKALSSGFDIAALVALGTGFATDPAGTASAVHGALAGAVDGTVSVIRDAVGV